MFTLSSRPVFDNLLQTQQKNSQAQKTLAVLNNKLSTLNQVNTTQTTQDLGWLLQVMPSKKQFDVLINQLRQIGNTNGASLVSYKSGASTKSEEFNLVAEFLVPDFGSMQRLLTGLENSLPLASITSVSLDSTKLVIEVKSAHSPILTVSRKIDEPLPDYVTNLTNLKASLSTYNTVAFPEVQPSSASAVVTDPFEPLPGSD
jgi:hypothetical protein